MLMMMGTPSGNEVKAPDVATVFIEDQEGGAAMVEYLPPGLENISNTCYMNATIQCLGASKELRSALVKSPLPLKNSPCLATRLPQYQLIKRAVSVGAGTNPSRAPTAPA